MKHFKENPGCLICLVIVAFVVISLAVTYWISVSDLPVWFKFALLNK